MIWRGRRTKAMDAAIARIALEQVDASFIRTRMSVSDPDVQRVPVGSPADKIADFLLNVAQVQETTILDKIAVGSIPYDVERSMSERMSATRRVVHYYRIAATAVAEHEYGTPDTESLPGLVLTLAILADSHPRAPGYVTIAPYTRQILEDYS